MSLLAFLIATTWAISSFAGPTSDANEEPRARSTAEKRASKLIDEGVQRREQGDDDKALDLFRKAHAISPSARARAQIALAEQALGMWVEAKSDLEAALAQADDPWIKRYEETLRAALRKIGEHVGTLELRGPPKGAQLRIDGRDAGPVSKRRWPLVTGEHEIEVSAAGYVSAHRTVSIAAGAVARETIVLATRATRGDREATAEGQPPARPPSEPGPQKPGWQTTLGWIGVGVGAALVGGGVAFQLARQGEIASYNDDASCPGTTSPDQPAGCQSRIDTASTFGALSVAGLIAGGVLTAGGVTLLVLPAPNADKEPRGALVGAAWRF